MTKTKSKSYTRRYDPTVGINLDRQNPTLGVLRSVNMYIDYENGGGALESIPGFRKIFSLGGRVYNILSMTDSDGEEYIYIHAGGGLYRFKRCERDSGERLTPVAYLADRQSYGVSLGRMIIISDGEKLVAVDKCGNIRILSDNPEIAGCKTIAFYQKRIFLSGNQASPDMLIYSSEIEDSIAEKLEFRRVFTGTYSEIRTILSAGSGLYVLSSGAGNSGKIEKITYDGEGFKVETKLDGSDIQEGAILSDGRLIFLSNGRILSYDLSENATLPVSDISAEVCDILDNGWTLSGLWRGYILLNRRDEFLLGDTRRLFSSKKGWFYLKNVGCHLNDRQVFRYATEADTGYFVHRNSDQICEGEPMSIVDENRKTLYFTELSGKKYAIYPTKERVGGRLSLPTATLSDRELLFFGTETGEICIFNNDKRGFAPENISPDDIKGYQPPSEKSIHPDYYSFDNHRVLYLAEFMPDDCDMPGIAKTTDGGNLTVKFKLLPKKSARLEVNSENKQLCDLKIFGSETEFSDLNFEALTIGGTQEISSHVPEKKAKWERKSIKISSEEFCSPFAIREVVFRYRTVGATKTKNIT